MDTGQVPGDFWGDEMMYLLDPSLKNATPQDKANAYANLRNQGISDTNIRSAAEAQFGPQSESDWGTLTGMAQSKLSPIGVGLPFIDMSKSDPTKYNTKNPYLAEMAGSITSQVNDNLNRNILPSISSGAQMVGGYGGSRQGVVEANAFKDANQGLSNSLTNMYYGDYNNAMNRQLQQYGMNQSYNLGLGNLALGFQNSGNNYALGLGNLALGNRNTDLGAVQLGANLFNMGNQGYMGQGQGIYNLGLTSQQAPWQTIGGMNSATQPYTGYGTTTNTNNGSSGAGFLGGAIAGNQLYNLYK